MPNIPSFILVLLLLLVLLRMVGGRFLVGSGFDESDLVVESIVVNTLNSSLHVYHLVVVALHLDFLTTDVFDNVVVTHNLESIDVEATLKLVLFVHHKLVVVTRDD